MFIAALLFFPAKRYSISPKTIAVFPVQVDDTLKGTSNVSWITLEIINNLNKMDEISVVDYSTVKNYSYYLQEYYRAKAKKDPSRIIETFYKKLVAAYEKKYNAERREIEAVLNKIDKDKLLRS